MPTPTLVGSIVSLWRYPVKSMLGEELNSAEVLPGGLSGDRAYALIDAADAKVASAKNPRKWPQLFDFRAAVDGSKAGMNAAVRITLPDGTIVASDQPDIDHVLSTALARKVQLRRAGAGTRKALAEAYWPDIDGLDHRDAVTDFGLPEGTFFDAATIHLLTTATIDELRERYSAGRFEARRFRPNIVVRPANGEKGFIENAWIGQTLAIGDAVRLTVTAPCFRCVMTTLPQGDLPSDNGILRATVQHNRGSAGVYISVLQGGTVRRGDSVRLE